jgi:hypothetical protein
MDLTLFIKEYATSIAALAALITLIKGVFEYTLANTIKRSDSFTELRIKFKTDEKFREICDLVDHNDPKLEQIEFKDKRDLLGFFEEVALKTNSGLIKKQVAHYMFGYYAIRCWECESFWNSINKYSIYWSLYRDFVYQMIEEERKLAEKFKIEAKSDKEKVGSIRNNFRL